MQRDVGRRVAELRVSRGWTQQALAERYGRSHGYIQAVERGAENLGIDSLVRLADVLGVGVATLFFRPHLERKVGRPSKQAGRLPFREVEPQPSDLYQRCVPLVSLEARAGTHAGARAVEIAAWVEPHAKARLTAGMFVAQIVGESMEPEVPSGSYCLFRAVGQTPPSGAIVLAQHRTGDDPDDAGAYVLKRLVVAKGKARLESRQRGVAPIELSPEGDGWTLVAVMVERLERPE